MIDLAYFIFSHFHFFFYFILFFKLKVKSIVWYYKLLHIILVISNTSIKNQITTSILYVQKDPNIAKVVYYAINITFTKVKLIRLSYNYQILIKLLLLLLWWIPRGCNIDMS